MYVNYFMNGHFLWCGDVVVMTESRLRTKYPQSYPQAFVPG
ncbi:hypothetical protein AFE_3306 [Acidithiobacillus ferrooxidans ATCC 23270]|uniref:Uncharacterized protein n=1 Tax=Acidithiobacillus ferrooxidans (strain ATCC 23270 / DSM 14882 / CIP 104768 / NCIMB 8455) TaxID=243159 RepID=B7JBI4_ACIF2|nr:hypothetical protein AFE_3306 [Acidithiobacillus ferrooxidans ATCC 23270]